MRWLLCVCLPSRATASSLKMASVTLCSGGPEKAGILKSLRPLFNLLKQEASKSARVTWLWRPAQWPQVVLPRGAMYALDFFLMGAPTTNVPSVWVAPSLSAWSALRWVRGVLMVLTGWFGKKLFNDCTGLFARFKV